ncbi:MAG: hypothetical protein LBG64_03750 [Pseudomonadales bacterium]|jgi:uncharacterized membrane protein YqjE|nr:hypothetical protein [Pseudomonadales bacterium]
MVKQNKATDYEQIDDLINQQTALYDALSKSMLTRKDLMIDSLKRHRGLIQKIGELSFVFGAAVTPIIIVNGTDEINNLAFVLFGICLYLLNGILSIWHIKDMLEEDGKNAPLVGIDMEIIINQMINAVGKLISNPKNKTYYEEYKNANLNYIHYQKEIINRKKLKFAISCWTDILLANFVVASLFVVKTLWIFDTLYYWAIFVAILLIMLAATINSFIKIADGWKILRNKQNKLSSLEQERIKFINKIISN